MKPQSLIRRVKEKLLAFLLSNPTWLDLAKHLLSNRHIANSRWYKRLVMKRVRQFVENKSDYQESISIETTLNCNARCIFCGHHNKVMSGTMTMELYRKIIDDCAQHGIKHINLSIYGEFLLDKYLFDRISCLRKHPDISYSFFSNASLLDKNKADRLLDMGGLAWVHFSVNAYSKEVYEKIMIGLDRDVVYRNILYFLEERKRRRLDNLCVKISAVKTDIGKDDFEELVEFWKKQDGVQIILSVDLLDRMGVEYHGELGPLGPMQKKDNWLAPCRMALEMLQIYYDGKVSPCCLEDERRRLIVGD